MNPQSTLPRPGQQPPQWGRTGMNTGAPVQYGSGLQHGRSRRIITVIAVVVIGLIVVGLVLAILNKRSAADTERKTDILRISKGLRTYAGEYDVYPSAAQISDTTYTKQYMADVPEVSFVDPSGDRIGDSDAKGYVYTPSPAGCDNQTSYCVSYTLSTTLSNGKKITLQASLD